MKLYDPSTPHANALDAIAEHCGVQWGMKRPIAEAILLHFYPEPEAVAESEASPVPETEQENN